MITLNNILVATDFGDASESALRYGRELAGRFGATLHVLNVAENVAIATLGAETFATVAPQLQEDIEANARKALDDVLIDSDHSGPVTRPAVMTSSSPAFAIVDYARDHDINLIVMGTNGRGALEHFLMGSVAERVVRLAGCPVLTVRSHERDFVHPDALAVRTGTRGASMSADFVASARDAVERMRVAKSHSAFTKALGEFMTALADAIEAPQLVAAARLADVQRLGEQAVDQVEAHICSDRHAQKLAGSIYEINRRLELIGRWVQHYTQEGHA